MRKGVWISVGFLAGYIAAANVHHAERAVSRGDASKFHNGSRGKRDGDDTASDVLSGNGSRSSQSPGEYNRPGFQAHIFNARGWITTVAVVGWLTSLIVGDLFSDITSFVWDVINPVASIESLASDVYNWVANLWDAMWNAVTNILDDFQNWEGLIEDVWDGVGSWFTDLENDLVGWWTDLFNDIWQDVIDPASWFFEQLWNAIYPYAEDLGNAIVHGLVDPILDAWDWVVESLGDIWNLVYPFVAQWWNDIYGDVIAPILGLAESVYGTVSNIAQWLESGAADVINAVEKAMEWIIWFGEHTFDDLTAFFSSVPSALEHWLINGFVQAQEDYTDEILSIIAEAAG